MLKIGIIGLPNVGKSSLFKALTKKQVDISNYPFCTINPNVGIIQIADENLSRIAEIFKSKKATPAAIEFVDIAGLVKNAHKGEGLGNQFLHHIRETDAILEVVRAFQNESISHIEKTIDPLRDIEIVKTELILKDLETVEKNLVKLKKEAKTGDQKIKEKLEIMKSLKNSLEKHNSLNSASKEEFKLARELELLSIKPILFAINGSNLAPDLLKFADQRVLMDIKDELDLNEMSQEEKIELGFESKLNELIKKSCEMLNLITFYTANENEASARVIPKNSQITKAAALVHSDFEKKFIRADVINYKVLFEAGGWQEAREKGLIRSEGKNYLVQNGDIIEFKI
jgi:hypothetical protein